MPISYAKTKIKSCICRTQGYRVKNIEDKNKFAARLQQTLEILLKEKNLLLKNLEKLETMDKNGEIF